MLDIFSLNVLRVMIDDQQTEFEIKYPHEGKRNIGQQLKVKLRQDSRYREQVRVAVH